MTRLAYSLVAIGLLVLALLAARFAYAYVQLELVDLRLDRLEATGTVPAAELSQLAQRLSWPAVVLQQDARLHLVQARLATTGALRDGASELERRVGLAVAVAHLREVTRVRPTWSRSWSGLAQGKALAGQFDSEFSDALVRALMRGPYEEGSLMVAGVLGTAAWEVLTESARQSVLTAIERARAHANAGFVRNFARALQGVCATRAQTPACSI